MQYRSNCGYQTVLTYCMYTFYEFVQVQMQMFVTQRLYADFITWTPHDCLIFRVKRDEEFIRLAVSTLKTFWLKHISPKLQELTDAQVWFNFHQFVKVMSLLL